MNHDQVFYFSIKNIKNNLQFKTKYSLTCALFFANTLTCALKIVVNNSLHTITKTLPKK